MSWSIRDDIWSFYHWLKPSPSPYLYKEDELYRLEKKYVPPQPFRYIPKNDLAEKENIISEEPEVAKKIKHQLHQFIKNIRRTTRKDF
jgi:hypothetical protein